MKIFFVCAQDGISNMVIAETVEEAKQIAIKVGLPTNNIDELTTCSFDKKNEFVSENKN